MCQDIVCLNSVTRTCSCKESWGSEPMHSLAELGGEALPMIIDAEGFLDYILNPPEKGEGINISGVLLPKKNRLFTSIVIVKRYVIVLANNWKKALVFETLQEAKEVSCSIKGYPSIYKVKVKKSAIGKKGDVSVFLAYNKKDVLSSDYTMFTLDEKAAMRIKLKKDGKID